ncbi:triose-phosphate isomerase [Candidatus Epulonipiscium fishelsonii]|uniref:Triose-phosphate isomerase n=1 Tax=Candidatus Epulonipiscium fishelsonii TaxID=77094 RepID=A0ACC8XF03_9FIRM|nr:triose-phosphate isomerase [Epulopiscium sp. SCG-B05WGA-EpuloA1]ONI42058.1 triose-phosphate isomerase [Epulopiscium sp. SCG-B11WGA-EpuloA1]
MRKKIVAGNWKMNKTPKQAVELVNSLKDKINTSAVDVVVCPTFVCLQAVLEAVKGTNIAVGAQNMYFEENGAYTGEISPEMLTSMGVKYVIIGHSERRQYFAETNETVNKKTLKAIEHKLIPIVCVGESLAEREQGITIDLVRLQTKIALKDVNKEDAKNVVIAYEPIWAIGTGKTATNEQAEEVCKAIRDVVSEIYDVETGDAVRVQYGGSVNAGNANALFNMGNIDGGLVGGASLKEEFASIVNY